MVAVLALEASVLVACGFESLHPHQRLIVTGTARPIPKTFCISSPEKVSVIDRGKRYRLMQLHTSAAYMYGEWLYAEG